MTVAWPSRSGGAAGPDGAGRATPDACSGAPGLDAGFAVVAACFLLSGFAALVYQTAWTRQFAFVFGTSELAVATVLAAYMGGLAAGAALAGRFAHRVRRPVLAYGLLELGVGLSALAVPAGIAGATRLLLALFGGAPGLPEASQLSISLFYLATSFLILMLPTAFMGATLPLLARHAVRSDAELGPRVGVLYAINTAGAVAGTFVTAFVLLPSLGLGGTVCLAVALNGLIFAVAAGLARLLPGAGPAAHAGRVRSTGARFVLPLIALSGVVSFTYEVLWTRLLTHLLGASVYAFATMLGSVLLGIAVGSAVASRYARRGLAAPGFAVAQLGAGALSWAAFLLADRLPGLVGADVSPLYGAGVSVAVLLPAALCIGATYPLAVRLLAGEADEAGAASARVYAWNTAGAIAGSVGAAFVLLPGLGFEGTLAVAVAGNFALALATALHGGRAHARLAVAACLAGAALLVLRPATPRHLLAASPLEGGQAASEQELFLAVGRSATVYVGAIWPGRWRMRTNGLPESVISARELEARSILGARWLGALPSLVRPEVRSLAVVGLGGAGTLEAVPRSVRQIDVVELEPKVLEANQRLAAERARNPLADPRVHVHLNDARSALLLTGRRFDAIAAQPSHPWTAGASHLYTREFFSLVASRLAPGGVFVQWMGAPYVDEPLLRSVVATLASVWPYLRVYRVPTNGSFLYVASDRPFAGPAGVARQLADDPETMAALGIGAPGDVDAYLVLDEAGARRYAEGAPLVTDDRNLLQMRSPFVAGSLVHPYEGLAAEDPLLRGSAPVEVATVRRLVEVGDRKRAARLVPRAPEGPERLTARALADASREEADLLLARALALRPEDEEARAALLLRQRAAASQGWPVPGLPARGASALEEAVCAGWRAQLAGDAAGLEALEPELATAAAGSPWLPAALELRARWRLDRGDDRALAEADRLVVAWLFRYGRADHAYLLAARIARARGRTEAMLGALAALAQRHPHGLDADLVVPARELLRSVPPGGRYDDWIARLLPRLQRRAGGIAAAG